VQSDRVASAHLLASHFNSTVVLKGAGSVCAFPDGSWFINRSGNPGMASAGMGDALAGILGALIAQGLTAGDALLLGVYLHGAGADACVERAVGPIGLTATEVIDGARGVLNDWAKGQKRVPG
jgi:ADP-dependent NAD(P)H-hydrate dehydratase / NAD(P)H-hydrate epimerase